MEWELPYITYITMKVKDIINQGYKNELVGTYEAIVNKIAKDDFGIISIQCYFKHIPTRSNLGWPEEIYNIADQCHRLLYEYCKKKQFLDSDTSYEDYLSGALFKAFQN